MYSGGLLLNQLSEVLLGYSTCGWFSGRLPCTPLHKEEIAKPALTSVLGSARAVPPDFPASGNGMWYTTPGTTWETSWLPIGNGYLAAMLPGGTAQETTQLNIESLWAGGPFQQPGYDGQSKPLKDRQELAEFVQISRQAVFASPNGTISDYDSVMGANFTYYGSYVGAGYLLSTLNSSSKVDNYVRWLDLDAAVTRTQWDEESTGSSFTRTTFCSNPLRACIEHTNATDGLPALTYTFSPYAEDGLPAPNVTCLDSSTLQLRGTAGDPGMLYELLGRATVVGGNVSCAAISGINGSVNATLTVSGASESWFTWVGDTEYDMEAGDPAHGFSFKGDDPHDALVSLIESATDSNTVYESILRQHISDYANVTTKFALDIGQKPDLDTPTDNLYKAYAVNSGDPYIEWLLFNFGRYLLVSSSRGALPANLQGKWAQYISNAWSADYHANINTQMNYWAAELTNLPEVTQPLWDYMEKTLVPRGQETALALYNTTQGWVTHDEMNIFGSTGMKLSAQGDQWANYPESNAWMAAIHVFDHFDYTHDVAWWQKQGWPLLKGVAQFHLTKLIADQHFNDSTLVVAPCNSPEQAPITFGCAHGQQLIWQLLNAADKGFASSGDDDTAFINEVRTKRDAMDRGIHIGNWGQFQEWKFDMDKPNDTHRHLSHLIGLYPGYALASYNVSLQPSYLPSGVLANYTSEAVIDAITTTLIHRGNGTGPDADSGWEKVWRAACWAQLRNADKFYFELSYAIERNYAGNFFSQYSPGNPPFQIDANLGYPAALLNALVQAPDTADLDQPLVVTLLPALPVSKWPDGSISGARLRGGMTLDFSWKNGVPTTGKVVVDGPSTLPRPVQVVYNGRVVASLSDKRTHASHAHERVRLDSHAQPIKAAGFPASGNGLWYLQPAKDWATKYLPIGNGYPGAMLAGGTAQENTQLNIESLWTGGPFEYSNYTGNNKPARDRDLLADFVRRSRQDVFASDNGTIEEYDSTMGVDSSLGGSYAGAGYLISSLGNQLSNASSQYSRWLDLDAALVRTQWTQANSTFLRTSFCSHPLHACVEHTESTATIAYLAYGLSISQEQALPPSNVTCYDNSTLMLRGRLSEPAGMLYEILARARSDSGEIYCSSVPSTNGNANATLTVRGGHEAWLTWTGDSEYDMNECGSLVSMLEEATDKRITYATILQDHIEDHNHVVSGFILDLGQVPDPSTPTDELYAEYETDVGNPYLEWVLFNYGRYLLASSARGSLPANLQGKWASDYTNAWSGDYVANINLQMNYWFADMTGMSELTQSLWDCMEKTWVPRGTATANILYNISHGWVTHNAVNLFGSTGMQLGEDGDEWANYPEAAAWMMIHVWDHFDYTHDVAWWKSQGWPLLKGVAQFQIAKLVEDVHFNDSTMVVAPCNSPEQAPITFGCAHAQQLIWQLLNAAEKCYKVAGDDDVAFIADVRDGLTRIDSGVHIGSWGQLQEWKFEMDKPDNTHRHLSHLVGLYPGYALASYSNTSQHTFAPSGTREDYTTEQVLSAARVSLQHRGNGTGPDADSGWEKVWRAACWAQLRDADAFYHELSYAIERNYAPNLFSMYAQNSPPFQIDANLGYPAALLNALVQAPDTATLDEPLIVTLLPALPMTKWPDGAVKGAHIRGGIIVDLTWKSGRLREAFLTMKGSKALHRPVKVVYAGDIVAKFNTEGSSNVKITV
ncbi:unnamed protein product [Peniophora sp. CBMAI 1063]|nr:unnamed protein product [Peniophora sp. CBMAI 1063]